MVMVLCEAPLQDALQVHPVCPDDRCPEEAPGDAVLFQVQCRQICTGEYILSQLQRLISPAEYRLLPAHRFSLPETQNIRRVFFQQAQHSARRALIQKFLQTAELRLQFILRLSRKHFYAVGQMKVHFLRDPLTAHIVFGRDPFQR